MKKRYYISIDLKQAGIEAESPEEALRIAKELIDEGSYTTYVCDEEKI